MKAFRFRAMTTIVAVGLMAGGASAGYTEVILTATNNTGQAANDFHIQVDSNGGNPTSFGLTGGWTNPAANSSTAGWGNAAGTAGAGDIGGGGTTADFKANGGAAIGGANGTGHFAFRNNTNYYKITKAYWTNNGAPITNANGVIIDAGIGINKVTHDAYSMNSPGESIYDPIRPEPVHYAGLIVKFGVPDAIAANITSMITAGGVTTADVLAWPGTTVVADLDGGQFQGVQTWNGPGIVTGTSFVAYMADAEGVQKFIVSGVPEPSSLALLALGSLAGFLRRR